MPKHVPHNAAIRTVATTITGAIACAALSTSAAGAATVVKLDSPSVTHQVGADVVTIAVKNHSVRLSPGMTASRTSRNATVTGSVSVRIEGTKATGGSIQPGYVVACQLDLASASVGISGPTDGSEGDDSTATDSRSVPPSSVSTGGSITLGSGTPKIEWLSEKSEFTGASGSVTYQDQTIGTDSCVGYAQARFFVRVQIWGPRSQATLALWGKPFSMG